MICLKSGVKAEGIERPKKRGILSDSVILSFLDRLCTKIYEMLKNGFFARIFTSYGGKLKSREKKVREKSFIRSFAQKTERSALMQLVRRIADGVMALRLKVIGIFFFAFAAVTGVLALTTGLMSDTGYIPRSHYSVMLFAGIILLSSLPLLSSRRTLYGGITDSTICSKVLPALGFPVDKLNYEGVTGRTIVALILGIAAGALSYIVSPIYIMAAVIGTVFVYLVMARPEFGMLCLFFITPLLPTVAVAALLILVALSYLLKVLRGKRRIVFEAVDLFVLILAALYVFGGFVSLSIRSLIPVSLRVGFLVGYFLVACIDHSREWLKRFTLSAIFSGVAVSLYGIAMYFFGSKGGNTWLDSSLFSDISGRAVSTLENPNMLGEYLAIMIPIAVAVLISGEMIKRSTSFLACCALAFCMVLTWSRGAWLALIFAMLILVFIWHRRSVWLVLGGAIALPLASFVMPTNILNRFLSIGNMADSSTSYRVNIWRGAMRMIRDHLFFGIGVGEDAWKKVYPDYTLPGIEKAPHAHNLFMQITVDMGIAALIVLLVILFFTFQSGFSVFSKISRTGSLDSTGLLRADELGRETVSGTEKNAKLAKLRLRMAVAGPMCGIFSVIVEGMTDYSWYNYRVYLVFWLVAALSVAFTKDARKYLKPDIPPDGEPDSHMAEVELPAK